MIESIPMKSTIEKLRDRQILAQMKPTSDHFYEWADFLAGRLNENLLPQGFAMAVELVNYDLKNGTDGYTRKPLQNRLVGLPPMVFSLMKMLLYRNLELILPADFAKEVHAFEASVRESVRQR